MDEDARGGGTLSRQISLSTDEWIHIIILS